MAGHSEVADGGRGQGPSGRGQGPSGRGHVNVPTDLRQTVINTYILLPDQEAVHTANGSIYRINTLLLLHSTTPAECMLILLNLTGAHILHLMKSFNKKTALRKHVQHLCFFDFEYFRSVSIY